MLHHERMSPSDVGFTAHMSLQIKCSLQNLLQTSLKETFIVYELK